MTENQKLDRYFDDLLFQTVSGGLTHEQLENGLRHDQFQKVKEWKSKYGFSFSIYGNEHLINGKKHFHFDNKEKEIFSKIDFEGNILEIKGKNIPSNIEKDLKYFLQKSYVKPLLEEFWNNKNPHLK